MREKRLMLIVTFAATASAMAMEKACAARGVPGRLIPVPAEVRAGCGMCWCAPVGERACVEAAARAAGIEADGWYERMV